MKAERTPAAPGPLIQGFAGRGFRVDGVSYEAVLLTPEEASAWAAPALDPAPEFVLLGTGANLTFPPRPFVAALEARGIGVEAMDSRAAARTWGVLRAEGRWIAAALMAL